jgi:hypothetical protein
MLIVLTSPLTVTFTLNADNVDLVTRVPHCDWIHSPVTVHILLRDCLSHADRSDDRPNLPGELMACLVLSAREQ